MHRPEQKLFALLILLGLATSVWVAWQRMRVESANRAVELVVDWSQVQEVATSFGLDPSVLLGRLKAEGVTGVAVAEDTLASLRDQGWITLQVTLVRTRGGRERYTTVLTSPSTEILERVAEHLGQRLGQRPSVGLVEGRGGMLMLPGTFDRFRSLGVGLPDGDIRELRALGFDVVGRVANYPIASAAVHEATLARLKRQGVRLVLFSGEEVLGYLDRLNQTGELLDRYGLLYGSVEFSKQRGDETLSRAVRSRLVRVHSVAAAEMGRLRVPELVERYVRSVEERNIRMLYLRLPSFTTKEGEQALQGYVRRIRAELSRAGYQVGLARPFQPFYPPRWAHYVMGAGATASLFLLLTWLFPLSTGWWVLLYVLGTATDLAALAVVPGFARRYLALKCALVFPSLAVLWAYGRGRRALPDPARVIPARRPTPILDFLAVAAISLVGGLFVVGLLSDRDFMVKTYQFMGIKAAHVLPLLGLALVMGLDFLAGQEPWREQWDRAVGRLRRLANQPLLIWQLLALGLAGVALLLLVARTGNDPGVGVSGLEMRLRGLLDQVLLVRPRTKEFLVGHPVLYLGLALGPLLGRRALALLLLIGAIGQVSLVNTFCHLHTPLHVSLIRAVNGLWVGLILGVALAVVVKRLLPRSRPTEARERPRAGAAAP